MIRVMIAVDGSELDTPLARTAHRLFGDNAEYWAVNVQRFDAATGAGVPAPVPAMYGGALVGFGGAYPIVAPGTYGNPGASGEDGTSVSDIAEERAGATVEAAVDGAGIVDAVSVAEVGDPPEAILRAAHDHDIDVIVVGDHDRSWWSELFAPAVGRQLIEHAEIPVLVVTRDAAERSWHGEAVS